VLTIESRWWTIRAEEGHTMKRSSQPRRRAKIIRAMEGIGRPCRPCEIRDYLTEVMREPTSTSSVHNTLARLRASGRVSVRQPSGGVPWYDLTDKEGGPLTGPRNEVRVRPYPRARGPVLAKQYDEGLL